MCVLDTSVGAINCSPFVVGLVLGTMREGDATFPVFLFFLFSPLALAAAAAEVGAAAAATAPAVALLALLRVPPMSPRAKYLLTFSLIQSPL